jgi:hypothetical protein
MAAGGGGFFAGAHQFHLSHPEMTEIHGHQVRSLLTYAFVDFLTTDRLLTIIIILDPLRLPGHGLNC